MGTNNGNVILIGVALVCTAVLAALKVIPGEAFSHLAIMVGGGALGAFNPQKKDG